VVSDGLRHWVQSATGEVRLVEIPRFPEPELEHVAGGYSAPMPGNIVAVNVEPGQRVSAGQVLVIVEAMKMEHLITCTEDGIVKEVRVTVGAQVEAGQVLLVVDTGHSAG
jgi:propionyl-CoA carboxylase alpha chain